MKYSLLLILATISFTLAAKAQDIIVKLDKSEIRCKVAEITPETIKYKKWEMPDGPLYNIARSDVFMIIYANGQREVIRQSQTAQAAGSTTSSEPVASASKQLLDTTINYQELKIKYKPTRLVASPETPLTIGFDQEVRVVKNTLNLGVAYYYTFPKDDYILEQTFGFIYASAYAPLNRLMGNYKNQDKGLFLFGQAGYAITTVKTLDFDGNTQSSSAGKFSWRIGADFMITRGFGINISTYEAKSFYGGITVSIL